MCLDFHLRKTYTRKAAQEQNLSHDFRLYLLEIFRTTPVSPPPPPRLHQCGQIRSFMIHDSVFFYPCPRLVRVNDIVLGCQKFRLAWGAPADTRVEDVFRLNQTLGAWGRGKRGWAANKRFNLFCFLCTTCGPWEVQLCE